MSAQPASTPAEPAQTETVDTGTIEFVDLNFKLAVIQELMYEQDLLTPQFVLGEFLAGNVDRDIDFTKEFTEPIPEVLEHFRQLPVPKELAINVEELYQDGGDDIYLELWPQWDGEDSTFDINDFQDLQHFPNLKTMTVMGVDDEALDGLRRRGIEADRL